MLEASIYTYCIFAQACVCKQEATCPSFNNDIIDERNRLLEQASYYETGVLEIDILGASSLLRRLEQTCASHVSNYVT